jgi:hypothetical protein
MYGAFRFLALKFAQSARQFFTGRETTLIKIVYSFNRYLVEVIYFFPALSV